MHKVKIFGHSDDNIEIEGTIPGADEYGAYKGAGKVVHAVKVLAEAGVDSDAFDDLVRKQRAKS